MMYEWEYSRNQRRHYVHDGKWYRTEHYLWEIRDCTPMFCVSQYHKEGYDLLYKGKLVKHGMIVKELKGEANEKVLCNA